MNKFITVFLAACAVVVMGVSCNKENSSQAPFGPEVEYVLGVSGGGFSADVETRATPVNSVPQTLYWGATTGGNTAGTTNETVRYAGNNNTQGIQASVSNGTVATGRYQTSPAASINWYVSNVNFAFSSGNPSLTVSNNQTDVVVGRTFGSSLTNPQVQLEHIFCRTGSVTINTTDGYSISVTGCDVQSPSNSTTGTAGVYNMRTGQWSSASTRLTSWTSLLNNADLWLIPGTYNIRLTYVLTKGDYNSGTQTKTAQVEFRKGRVNNIVGQLTGSGASEITIGITLEPWSSTDAQVNFGTN